MHFRDENIRFAKTFDISPQAFSDPIIVVELPEDAVGKKGNTEAFLLALNLLSRTFEHVHAVFPQGHEALGHPWALDSVVEIVDELNTTIEGTIGIGQPSRADVSLSIGGRSRLSARREVVVRGSSWSAALDCELLNMKDGALGSLYAACMGAAQVLLHVLECLGAPYRPMAPSVFSLLDSLPTARDIDMPKGIVIPETCLVGVGAVGSAAIYALAHLDDVSGTLHLIDNEKVDATNLNRYVLMRSGDVRSWKVEVGNAALSRSSIRAISHRNAFSRYVEDHGSDIDLLLSPVDSEEGRRELAKYLPRRVINAATGGTTVTVSRHGFNDGKFCLHCLYPVHTKRLSREKIMAQDMGLALDLVLELVRSNTPLDEDLVREIEKNRGVEEGKWSCNVGYPIDSFYAKAVCGDAELRLPSANVIAPLAFVSASAGIIMAAELIKAGHQELNKWSLDNYLRIDTLRVANPAFRKQRAPDPTKACICNDQDYCDVYAEKYDA